MEPPDVIFIYLWARNPDAIEFCQQIRGMTKTNHIPVVVWGGRVPEGICDQLQEVGATGFLAQPCHPDEIVAAYDTVMRGETYYPIE